MTKDHDADPLQQHHDSRNPFAIKSKLRNETSKQTGLQRIQLESNRHSSTREVAMWHRPFTNLLSFVIGLACAASAASAFANATFKIIWSSDENGATAVSDDGSVIVGFNEDGYDQPARWAANGAMTTLSTDHGSAQDVSADGSVIVGYTFPGLFPTSQAAFRWTAADGLVELDNPLNDVNAGIASGVSGDGSVIVGGTSSYFASRAEAFRWTTQTGTIGLGDLAGGDFWSYASDISRDGAVIVGSAISWSGKEAFRWTNEGGMVGLGDLPGGVFFSEAYATSADGSVVVGSSSAGFATEAFRWTEATGMVGLGHLPGGYASRAAAVSADGSVVVGYDQINPTGFQRAFYWTGALGMVDLRDLLISQGAQDLDGVSLASADGISSDGRTIVGKGFSLAGSSVWIATMGPPITPGDINADGVVNTLDLARLTDNLGMRAAATLFDGDLTGDGRISLADLVALRNHWTTTSIGAASAAVPEPMTWLLAACSLAAFARRRGAACAESPHAAYF